MNRAGAPGQLVPRPRDTSTVQSWTFCPTTTGRPFSPKCGAIRKPIIFSILCSTLCISLQPTTERTSRGSLAAEYGQVEETVHTKVFTETIWLHKVASTWLPLILFRTSFAAIPCDAVTKAWSRTCRCTSYPNNTVQPSHSTLFPGFQSPCGPAAPTGTRSMGFSRQTTLYSPPSTFLAKPLLRPAGIPVH